MLSSALVLVVLCGMAGGARGALDETLFIRFEGDRLPEALTQNGVEARMVKHKGRLAMEVAYGVTDWPNMFFSPREGTWDWSAHAGIVATLYNPGDEPVVANMRVDNAGADGMNHCNNGTASVPAGGRAELRVQFNTGTAGRFWGMRGIPECGPVGSGAVLDMTAITAFQIFLAKPEKPYTLILEDVRLYGEGADLAENVPFPFIDAFGQYKHDSWPGKVKSERDLERAREREAKALRRNPALPGRDRFGGWAAGPRLEATGWFRTERVDGVWWLVTPEGNLFFSAGVDCVGTWEETFVEGRDGWFEGLPDPEAEASKGFYGHVQGAHSMADSIGGAGRTFRHYQHNLSRKYGEDWPEMWRNTSYARLQAWGFNTIANWSQEDVLVNSPMPFVASLGVWGEVREVEGSKGYWGRMKDVYDPAFAEAVDRSVAQGTAKHAANPLCIGYFFDNELSWEAVRRGVLASPPDQPARAAFIALLEKQYRTIDKLNEVWGTSAKDWDALAVPESPNDACNSDLDDLEYAFAHRYFTIVNDAIKKHAPNQLYLGCRFSSAPEWAVRACADVADVVSFNLYRPRIDSARYTGENDLGKPCIVGEFHFGALDRGMFHTGLVPTETQRDRARHYMDYVRSVADCPAFVGCHWFQYVDEPTTGRWFDGENYNIGFVNVADTPYPELVKAAKKVHGEVYERRARLAAP